MADEAKEEQNPAVSEQVDKKVDELLDKREQETPSETSTEKETTETETKETEAPATEQPKPEEPKPEEEVPKEFHKHPAWQRIMRERDELKESQKGALSKEDIDSFKKVTSSPEYIQTSMKSQGFTQEAINKALKERGFEIPEAPTDDLALVLGKLNVDPKALSDEQRGSVGDIAKITRIIAQDIIGKTLPGQLKPLQEQAEKITQTTEADRNDAAMQETVKSEGILDYKKDILPELNKFLDEHPDAFQEEVFNYFKEINHKLSIERLKTGKRKTERDEKKEGNRPITETAKPKVGLPDRTGDYEKDLDAALDHLNIT